MATTTSEQQRRGGRLVHLLAAVLTGVVTVLLGATTGAGMASAATVSPAGSESASSVPASQTRVGVSSSDLILLVGVNERIGAGQGRGDGPSQPQMVVGRCVAAEDSSLAFRSDTSHIFRDAPGHLLDDTPANRALLQGAVKPGNLRSTITLPDGSTLAKYFETLPDGSQVWVEVRNGTEITNGGVNATSR